MDSGDASGHTGGGIQNLAVSDGLLPSQPRQFTVGSSSSSTRKVKLKDGLEKY